MEQNFRLIISRSSEEYIILPPQSLGLLKFIINN
jgi:hypothetical protein